MATCPRCLGALTDHHRCPRGRFRRVADALLTVLVGGGIGAFLVFTVHDRPATALVLSASALGAVLASALRQAVNPRF
jgi:hypothetical protein